MSGDWFVNGSFAGGCDAFSLKAAYRVARSLAVAYPSAWGDEIGGTPPRWWNVSFERTERHDGRRFDSPRTGFTLFRARGAS